MEHTLTTRIDFLKDFEDHMRELAAEISRLHTHSSLTWKDDYSTLMKFNGEENADTDLYIPF